PSEKRPGNAASSTGPSRLSSIPMLSSVNAAYQSVMNRRLLWMLFVFCRSEALRGCVLFTDVGATLCVAVILGAMKVIDFGAEVDPYDGVRRAMSLRLALLSKLIRTHRGFGGRARARRCRTRWGRLLLSGETG